MFPSHELQYLLAAVNNMDFGNTNESRNKAYMITKLSDMLDEKVEEEQKAAEEAAAKAELVAEAKASKKKVVRKKK